MNKLIAVSVLLQRSVNGDMMLAMTAAPHASGKKPCVIRRPAKLLQESTDGVCRQCGSRIIPADKSARQCVPKRFGISV